MNLSQPPSGFPGSVPPPPPFAVGDRVRTLVQLTSDARVCGCAPEVCRDLPIGSLGTVDYISPPPHPSRPPRPFDGCGVLFDHDHHHLSCWMKPDEIEKVPTEGDTDGH